MRSGQASYIIPETWGRFLEAGSQKGQRTWCLVLLSDPWPSPCGKVSHQACHTHGKSVIRPDRRSRVQAIGEGNQGSRNLRDKPDSALPDGRTTDSNHGIAFC